MEGEEKRKEELNEVLEKRGSFSGFKRGITIFPTGFLIVISNFSEIFMIAIEKLTTFLPVPPN